MTQESTGNVEDIFYNYFKLFLDHSIMMNNYLTNSLLQVITLAKLFKF